MGGTRESRVGLTIGIAGKRREKVGVSEQVSLEDHPPPAIATGAVQDVLG